MLSEVFAELKRITGCKHVALRLDCDNAETVYVEEASRGKFLVYDEYETFATLRDYPEDYQAPHEFGFQGIRDICAETGLGLIDLYPVETDAEDEQTFAIVAYASEFDVREKIACVAETIDRIFDEARAARRRRSE